MKCLNQEGVKYLWSRIKATFATSDEVSSKCGAVTSGLTTQITNHTDNTSNPHNVTKAQIGLGEFNYEEGIFTPKLWNSSGVTQTFNFVNGYYKRIGNLCYINIYAFAPSGVSVKRIDNLPFAPSTDIYRKSRPDYLKGTVFANGVGCVVNVPSSHGQIELVSEVTQTLLVEGIYSI